MIKWYDFTVINEPLNRFYLALSDTIPTVDYLAYFETNNSITSNLTVH